MKKRNTLMIPAHVGQLECRINLVALDPVKLPKNSPSEKWAVICHPHPQFGGTMDNKVVTTLERTYQSKGFNTVVFQFRGVGQSDGEYDEGEGEQQDLADVVNFIRDNYAVDNLVLAGFSFGSYVALKQAVALNVDSLVVVAPPVNLYDFSTIELGKIPWTVIQGGDDEVVPAKDVLDWVMAQPNEPDVYWRGGASHFFHRQLIWLKKVITLNER